MYMYSICLIYPFLVYGYFVYAFCIMNVLWCMLGNNSLCRYMLSFILVIYLGEVLEYVITIYDSKLFLLRNQRLKSKAAFLLVLYQSSKFFTFLSALISVLLIIDILVVGHAVSQFKFVFSSLLIIVTFSCAFFSNAKMSNKILCPLKKIIYYLSFYYCCCSVTMFICDPMYCSTPGFPDPHHLPKFAQVHIYCISDAIQPSHPLTPSSFPSALNLSQHQGLFQSQLFVSADQNTGTSASASVLAMSIQG